MPIEAAVANPKPIRRPRWKRTAIELNGCIESKYKRELSGLLVQSYSQIGEFPHLYRVNGRPCRTYMYQAMYLDQPESFRRIGVSGLEFDNQGIYLASVTKTGCLMVHDFESLYCQSNVTSTWWKEDETKHLLHIDTKRQLDSVRWNPADQVEVACTSLRSGEIMIFDIGYVSSDPVEILLKRPTIVIHASEVITCFSDVAFTSHDSRVFASGTDGSINIWDRRRSRFPSVELTTNSHNALNSIQLNVENQVYSGFSGLMFVCLVIHLKHDILKYICTLHRIYHNIVDEKC